MIIFLLIFLLFATPAGAATLFSENWDAYTSNWSLQHDTDGSDGYCPDDVFGFGPYANCAAGSGSVSGDHSKVEITDAARRGTSGRGFRINIDPASVCVTVENGVTANLIYPTTYDFYIRWYFRANFNGQTSYKKLFRIKDGIAPNYSQRFIIDLYNMTGGTKFTLFTAADSFNGYGSPIPNWSLEANYTPNTWICVEAFVNQTNDTVTWWINGLQQGSPVPFAASNYGMRGLMVGGNQCGNGNVGGVSIGTDAIIDYDDIVISTTYVGPIGGGSGDTTLPVVTITSPTSSATYSTITTPVTVSGTATDDTAVTSVTWTNSAGGSGACTGTATWSCASIPLVSGTNTITIRGYDAVGNIGIDTLAITYDVTAPVITSTTSATQACTTNPLLLPLTVTTGESARCRYSTSDLAYSSMSASNTMDTTYALSHSASISLACGSSYTYYVACIDSLTNENSIANNLAIPFTIAAAADTTAAVISGLSPSGGVICSTNPYYASYSATTNEAATCKMGLTDTTYALMPYTMTGTGTSHTYTSLIGVTCSDPETSQDETWYVRCTNAAGLVNTTSASAIWGSGESPPLSSISPTAGSTQSCPSSPVNVTLSLSTLVGATCRYHPTNTTWAGMTAMSTTGSVSHSQVVSNTCGSSYSYNFLCRNSYGDQSMLGSTYYSVTAAITLPTNLRLYNGAEMLNGAQMR